MVLGVGTWLSGGMVEVEEGNWKRFMVEHDGFAM